MECCMAVRRPEFKSPEWALWLRVVPKTTSKRSTHHTWELCLWCTRAIPRCLLEPNDVWSLALIMCALVMERMPLHDLGMTVEPPVLSCDLSELLRAVIWSYVCWHNSINPEKRICLQLLSSMAGNWHRRNKWSQLIVCMYKTNKVYKCCHWFQKLHFGPWIEHTVV